MEKFFLARQALPLRGDWHSDQGRETDSNFIQLLKLRCEGSPSIVEWLERKKFKYTSPTIQNELLEVRICHNSRVHLIFLLEHSEFKNVHNSESYEAFMFLIF